MQVAIGGSPTSEASRRPMSSRKEALVVRSRDGRPQGTAGRRRRSVAAERGVGSITARHAAARSVR